MSFLTPTTYFGILSPVTAKKVVMRGRSRFAVGVRRTIKRFLSAFFVASMVEHNGELRLAVSYTRSTNPLLLGHQFRSWLLSFSNCRKLTMTNIISLSDLNTTVNHEPRIAHQKLAKALGFSRPHQLLRLIERNIEEFKRYGEVCVTVTQTTKSGGRPGKTAWLNEPQLILGTLRSDAPNAPDARQNVIEVFMQFRRGTEKPAIEQKPTIEAKPQPISPSYIELRDKYTQAQLDRDAYKNEVIYQRHQMKTFFVWIDKLIMEGRRV